MLRFLLQRLALAACVCLTVSFLAFVLCEKAYMT